MRPIHFLVLWSCLLGISQAAQMENRRPKAVYYFAEGTALSGGEKLNLTVFGKRQATRKPNVYLETQTTIFADGSRETSFYEMDLKNKRLTTYSSDGKTPRGKGKIDCQGKPWAWKKCEYDYQYVGPSYPAGRITGVDIHPNDGKVFYIAEATLSGKNKKEGTRFKAAMQVIKRETYLALAKGVGVDRDLDPRQSESAVAE